MAMKLCVECKTAISTDANPCPHCGKKNPHGASKIVVFGLPFLVCCFVLARCLGNDHSSGPSSDAQAAPDPAQQAPAAARPPQPKLAQQAAQAPSAAMRVSAKQLWDDYQANEVRADEQYKGKSLLVTGTVQSIDKDFMDNIVVVLATPNQFMGIHATLQDSQKAMASRLSKGHQITMVCNGQGMVVGDPVLEDCAFQ